MTRHKITIVTLSKAGYMLLVVTALAACNGLEPTLPAQDTQVAASSTPIRYPTLPPEWTATWTPAPTPVRPTATTTGTPTTAAPTATDVLPTASAMPPAQTACDHPWLPLRQGAHWEYQMLGGRLTWTVTSVSGDMENAAATVELKFPTSTHIYHFTCDAEGLKIHDFDYTVFDQNGVQENPDVMFSDGVWLPPASELDTAPLFDRWGENFGVTYGPGPGITRTVTYIMEIDGQNQTMSVPAGQFNTLDVNWDSHGESIRSDSAIKNVQSNVGNMFFARGVGIVVFNWPPDSDTSAKLVSYTLP